MIQKIGQVMLYVNDVEAAAAFWTGKIGFVVMAESGAEEGTRWFEIAPAPTAETSFVLHDKNVIGELEPDLNLGTPSILFTTENLDELYRAFHEKEVKTGEIVTLPGGRVFNFADNEDNYFAVMEKTS